jgi:regulator of protease activity HflC (stomatin/prohibitin superfamily)
MSDLPEQRRPQRSPWLQAGGLAFMALYAVTLLVALRWAFSNVRQVDPAHSAVVVRLGAQHRYHGAGLLWAWPQPFERMVLLPSAESAMEHQVQALLRSQQALQAEMASSDEDEAEPLDDALAGSGFLLTGDNGIVQMDVRVFYRITAPFEYALQRDHVLPALDRLVTRTVLAVCAARDLDTILVARPELVETQSDAAGQRERLRSDVLRAVNAGLQALQAAGAGLGIEVTRVDVQSKLPRPTVASFNTVLTASQMVERNLAEARSDAAWTTQNATQAADRILQVAHAQASERLAKAQADTAAVLQLAQSVQDRVDPGLSLRVYRERMAAIFAKAGAVTLIDPKDGSRLIVPGAGP